MLERKRAKGKIKEDILMLDDDIYYGEIDKRGRKYGKGTLKTALPHSLEGLYISDEQKFVGTFVADEIEGICVKTYDGNISVHEYKRGLFFGKATEYLKTGRIFNRIYTENERCVQSRLIVDRADAFYSEDGRP